MSDKKKEININKCGYNIMDTVTCSPIKSYKPLYYGDDNNWNNLSKYCRKNMQQSVISCIPKPCSGDNRYVGCTDTCKIDRTGYGACQSVCNAKYTRDTNSRSCCLKDCEKKKDIVEQGEDYVLPKLCSKYI